MAPFQGESLSQERSVSYTRCLPGLEQGSADLLSDSRLTGRPAVELAGGREGGDTAGSNQTKGKGKAMQGLKGRDVQSGETGASESATSLRLGLVPGSRKDRISKLRTHTFEESSPVATIGPRHLE